MGETSTTNWTGDIIGISVIGKTQPPCQGLIRELSLITSYQYFFCRGWKWILLLWRDDLMELLSWYYRKNRIKRKLSAGYKMFRNGQEAFVVYILQMQQGENEKQWIMQSTWKALLKAYVYTNLWFSEVSWRLPLQSENDFWPNLKHYFQVRVAVKTNTKEFSAFSTLLFLASATNIRCLLTVHFIMFELAPSCPSLFSTSHPTQIF